jgi:hypothetical protein
MILSNSSSASAQNSENPDSLISRFSISQTLFPLPWPPGTPGIVSRRLVVPWKGLPILLELFAFPRHYQY